MEELVISLINQTDIKLKNDRTDYYDIIEWLKNPSSESYTLRVDNRKKVTIYARSIVSFEQINENL